MLNFLRVLLSFAAALYADYKASKERRKIESEVKAEVQKEEDIKRAKAIDNSSSTSHDFVRIVPRPQTDANRK